MKIKLAVIMPNLKQGGAEKVITTLLNSFDRNKFELYLILISKEGEFLKQLKTDITVIDLNCKHVRFSIIQLLNEMKKLQPDILFSSLSYISLYISIFKFLFPKNIQIIARESSILSITAKTFLYKILYKIFYTKLDYIIAQSAYMQSDLKKFLNTLKGNITIISNPVDIEKINKLSKESVTEMNLDQEYLIYVGRLSDEKKIEDQIFAMQELKDFKLVLVGDGTLFEKLQQLVQKLSLTQRVIFLGYQDNPYKYIKKAKFLLMTSKYEGYPNVAIEAMSLGVPVISYDIPGGIHDIIVEKVNGIITKENTWECLVETIIVNKNYEFKKQNVKESVFHHAKELVVEEYENFFSTKLV